MTLLTAVFAAVSTTVLWYFKDGENQIKLGTLFLNMLNWAWNILFLCQQIC